jgi:hypothetical protein
MLKSCKKNHNNIATIIKIQNDKNFIRPKGKQKHHPYKKHAISKITDPKKNRLVINHIG